MHILNGSEHGQLYVLSYTNGHVLTTTNWKLEHTWQLNTSTQYWNTSSNSNGSILERFLAGFRRQTYF